MAYQARGRDPIFAEETQAMIERRGREMIGLAMLVLAVLAALLLGSYSPEDPGWLAVTDGEVQNALGRVGAAIASPLMVIVGLASWGFALAFLTWGVRFVRHKGAERFLSRIIFVPIAIALASVYAATLVPGAGWTHSFGLGGLFGDTVSGAVLGVSPFSMALSLKVLTVLSGLAMLVVGLFSLGFTMPELKRIGRFLVLGVVVAYAFLASLTGKGARKAAIGAAHAARGAAVGAVGAARGARQLRARRGERRAHMAPEEPLVEDAPAAFAPPPPLSTGRVLRADPLPADLVAEVEAEPEAAPKGGLFSRMPGLKKRPAAPEPLSEPEPAPSVDDLTGEDRIRAKISLALKNRVRQAAVSPSAGLKAEPPLLRPRGPRPMILDTSPQVAAPAIDEAGLVARHDGYAPAPTPDDGPSAPAPEPHVTPQPVPMPEAKKVVQHPPRKAVKPSERARAEAQPRLQFEEAAAEYELPPLSLLASPASVPRHHLSDQALEENARMLETVLDDYGIKGEIVSVRPGPVVTMYELEPAPGLKASRVIGLADDIARSMSALSARVSTVPGRSVIGIELPNENREKVMLREILSTRDFDDRNLRLPLALGKDIGGDPIVVNLAKMPHLLIAGTTGSGKSVAINTMILSLLYRLTPEECRLIMIDPKMLELSVYDGIPHLLSPVVTDPKKAVVALKWVVGEMEDRYRKMSKMGVRNIEGYNGKVRDALAKGEMFSRTVQTGFDEETGEPIFETEEFAPETLPYIVVVVDEMADLMMVSGKEIEAAIQRLAQMARAAGIHLIMATQRPSVDVITGTIKANFPTRISFQVTSKIDSRTILGEPGAEQLLGAGDMLFMPGAGRVKRVHGPFVGDDEVEQIVAFLKQTGQPDYREDITVEAEEAAGTAAGGGEKVDSRYDEAVALVTRERKASTSFVQRHLQIGYNRAARIIEQMEAEGVISPANHVGKREVLARDIDDAES